MKRAVFHHTAYEAYPDLLRDVRGLLPLVLHEPAILAERFIELDREAHARSNRPYSIGRDEAQATRTRLASFGVVGAFPEVVAGGKWRFLMRSLARLERIRELGGPVDLFRDDFLKGVHDLTAGPYVAPDGLHWLRPCDLVHDAVVLAATTLDDVGIAAAINDTPEADAFFERYPDAYSFWDIHGTPDLADDPERPEPLRYPGAIWTAAAISLAEPFAEVPCGIAGPATIQPAGVPPAAGLHPALATACETATRNGHALVGYIEVHP
jgi:hypothetical protein